MSDNAALPTLAKAKSESTLSATGLGSPEYKESIQSGDASSSLDTSEVNERAVFRKIDTWILPVATMFYFLSFLDRSNISNARVAGLQKSLNISNYQFSMALTFTYVPYILAELPSNLLLKVIGPNYLLPFLVVSWGLITTLQGLVHNYAGLMACRVLLGFMEGGLFPGLVLWLSMFYPRAKLQLRVSMFFAVASLSGAFSGLLAAAISKLDGVAGLEGWKWIFILEGIFTVLFGFGSAFIMTKSPLTAKWLTPAERQWLNDTLQADGSIARKGEDDSFRWSEVWKTISSIHVLLLCIALFFTGTMLFGFALFEPAIVAGLGTYTPIQIQLLSVPPFAVGFVVSIASGYIADRYHARGLTIIAMGASALVGYIMYIASDNQKVKYGSLFLSLPGVYSCAPALCTWIANNSAPHVRRATAIAVGFSCSSIGGILSTWLLGTLSPGPKYLLATKIFIGFSAGLVIVPAVCMLYLKTENNRKAKATEGGPVTEPNGLGDKSVYFVYKL